MQKPTHKHISKHANKRISQRTGLSSFDVAQLIHQKQYVHLGTKPGQIKEYLLFYNQQSEDYFVIFRDAIDGTVITVLLLDQYENNLLCRVTDIQKDQARKLISTIQYRESQRPSLIYVVAGYINCDGKLKIKTLKKFPICMHGEDIHSFVDSHLDKFELKSMATEKSINYETIQWFSIRLGDSGSRIVLLPPEK